MNPFVAICTVNVALILGSFMMTMSVLILLVQWSAKTLGYPWTGGMSKEVTRFAKSWLLFSLFPIFIGLVLNSVVS